MEDIPVTESTMPFYKVRNAERNMKKCVIATSLEEFKRKGSEKLGLEGEVKAVLGVDGTEIEEDEVLEVFAGKVIILLQGGEEWCSDTSQEQPEAIRSQLTTLNTEDDKQKKVPESQIEEGIVEKESPVATVLSNGTESLVSPNKTQISDEISSITLPSYSTFVLMHLKENRVEIVWNRLISETAEYYFSRFPAIGDASHYRAIGQKVYSSFPCIKMESGIHPWSFFTKGVSQKIRHMRHSIKRKSQPIPVLDDSASPPKRPATSMVNAPPVAPELSPKDIQSHVQELKQEWRKMKKNRNIDHIKMLLKETKEYRDSLLKSSDSIMKSVIQEFPCFTDALFVLFEFSLRFGKERMKQLSENLKKLVATCCRLMEKGTRCEDDDTSTLLEVIQYLEQETKFDRAGKNSKQHFSSLIKIIDDVMDTDIDGILQTKHMASPHIVLLRSEGNVKGVFIVGDECKIRCQGSSVSSALLQLLAVYYVFDIEYPKCYAMLLAVLQQFVMSEQFTFETSKKYKFFFKKFRPVFDSIAI